MLHVAIHRVFTESCAKNSISLACDFSPIDLDLESAANMTSLLQFSPFASVLTPEFWTTFSKLKIESLRLSDEAVTVHATYSAGKAVLVRETGQQLSLGASIHLGSEAFDDPGLEKM